MPTTTLPRAGALIRTWRERALLTQEQLAELSGLSARTIRRIEGDHLLRPRSSSVYALAEALRLGLAERDILVSAFRDGVASAPPRQLPAGSPHFIGRDRELALLHAALEAPQAAAPAVLAVVGGAGMGKTALAVRWCASVAAGFPGGQLYLNLRGFGTLSPLEPLAALQSLLYGMGVPQQRIPADLAGAAALFRTCTAERRLVVLLDNALNSEQVRPLLPAPGSVAVVTSRDQLRGLTATAATARVNVPPLQPAESVALLSRVSGLPAITWDDPAVRRLADLCGHSPLALRIIAERLAREPATRLPDLVEEIQRVRLDAFSGSEDLRTILSWSYESLDQDGAWLLRVLGALHPGPDFGVETASALSGFTEERAAVLLSRLEATHLLERTGSGRYHLHDLVRAYAAAESRRHDTADARREAVTRLLDRFLDRLYAADAAFAPDRVRDVVGLAEPAAFPDLPAALSWCKEEHQTLVALPAWACAQERPLAACQVAYLLESYLAHYKCYYELLESHQPALRAVAELDDPRLEGHLLSAIGNTLSELRRPDAMPHYRLALLAFRSCGDRVGAAKVLCNLAAAEVDLRNYRAAIVRCREALAAADAAGYQRGRAHTLDTLAEAHLGLGDYPAAIECWNRTLDINRAGGAPFVVATNLTNLGRAHAAAGDHATAIGLHGEAIAISRGIGSARGEAAALHNLAAAHRATGDTAAARAALRRALVLYRRLGDPRAREIQQTLGTRMSGQ